MKSKFIIIFILFITQILKIHGQTINFNKEYSFNNQYFICNNFQCLSDSSYVIAGMEGSSQINGYFLLRLNQFGDTIWKRSYFDTVWFNPYRGKSVFQLSQNTIVLFSENTIGNQYRIIASYYDLAGNLITQFPINPSFDFLINYGIKLNNYFYLTGIIIDSSSTYNILLKLDSNCSIIQINNLSLFNTYVSESIIKWKQNNFLCAGTQFDSTISLTYQCFKDIDSTGTTLDSIVIQDTSYKFITSLKPTANSAAIATLRIDSAGLKFVRLIYLDTNNVIFPICNINTGDDNTTCNQTKDENYVVAYSDDSSIIVNKYDLTGSILWSTNVSVPHVIINLRGCHVNSDGDIIIEGWCEDDQPLAHPTFFISIEDLISNVADINESSFKAYPNPIYSDYLKLDCEDCNSINEIDLFNFNAQFIAKVNFYLINPNELNLYIPQFIKSGNYFIYIKKENNIIIKKISIQR